MKDFKRLMLGLDFSEMDKTLIEYLAFICDKYTPEKIYFFHASKKLSVEKELKEKYPELKTPRDEKLKEEMVELVKDHFPRVDEFDVDYKVIEGSPLKEALHWSEIKNIDLILLGRKHELNGSGILPQNISRKINCSLLFVPEEPKLKIENILVPCDFSENSNAALEQALRITEKNPDAKAYYHHIYSLPDGYYYAGKTEEEFAKIMHDNAVKKYNKSIEKLGHTGKPIHPIFTFDNGEDHSKLILKKATEKEADMIIMGAKGRTFATALLLGSVTEKLLRINDTIPVLVVKNKDHNLNILEWFKIA